MYRIVNDTNTQVEYIYMASKSQESSADWYGDFIYYENYLQKYVCKSKLWDYKIMEGSSRGSGIAGVLVKTTLDALKLLGWELDYERYKCTKEYYDSVK